MNLTNQQKAIKIAALAIISVAAFCVAYHIYFSYIWDAPSYFALAMLLLFVFFAAFGEMVATIFKDSFEKYVIANIVPALIFIPDAAVFAILAMVDFSQPEVIMPGIRATFLWNLLVFGVPAVASIIFGRFVIHKKKRLAQPSEANN